MAYSWQTEPKHGEPQEGRYDPQQFLHVNQHLSSRQVGLGFDQLVEEIINKTPMSEGEKEEESGLGPDAPNLGSKCQSICAAHPRLFSDFTPDPSQLHSGETSAIGFNPAVLTPHRLTHGGASWSNPTGKYHSVEHPGLNALTPSSTTLDDCNPPGLSRTKHHNDDVELEGNIPRHYSSYSRDSMPNRGERRSGDVDLVEPSLEFSRASLLPGASQKVSVESTE
ncbi:Phosphatidylinositol 4-phosphate 3-kinase C2 domain-containing subunit gamma [Apodemus speciosus]|uniref:Phosphatidylinositol 4-phosphate 3-kinase C2 domain-containing subunit gamma n=1 Tax=Apodemus speciosus TaxID=105296 RepID=A0ABQ0EWG1_APOSI